MGPIPVLYEAQECRRRGVKVGGGQEPEMGSTTSRTSDLEGNV